MTETRVIQFALVVDSGLLLALLIAVLQVTFSLGQLKAKLDTMWQWYLDSVKRNEE